MKIYEVVLTKRAFADADEAFIWLFNEEPDAALKWYEELLVAFRSLAHSPRRWGLAREDPFFDEEIRQLVYGRYRVLFTVKNTRVFVLRVRHGSRETLSPKDQE